MIKPPPIQKPFDKDANPDRDWQEWAQQVHRQLKYQGEFTTANRPLNGVNDGDWMIDTTLTKPIWYYNGGWIDATGASV